MNQEQAKARLLALLGKHAHYELRPDAPDAETRAAFREQARQATEHYQALEKTRENRERELLADPAYRELCEQAKQARQARDSARWRSGCCRITVGTRSEVGGLGLFSVKASGDTWADVIDQLEQKRKGSCG